MEIKPLVSISCITYNHAPYIRQCLDGFLMQKTTFPFEILIHDDASTDNTADIIREYERKYPDIIKPIYQKENQYSKGIPISATFNWPRAMGKYIALCEGDDYWIDPLKLQKQIDVLEKDPACSLCFHNAIIKNFQNNTEIEFNKKGKKNVYSIRDAIVRSWFTPTASFVFRNDARICNKQCKNVNGDMLLLYSAALVGYLYYIDEIMSVYNYCTQYSLSRQRNYMVLYKKKFYLLRYLDKTTHYKYILYTMFQRVKILGSIALKVIKS